MRCEYMRRREGTGQRVLFGKNKNFVFFVHSNLYYAISKLNRITYYCHSCIITEIDNYFALFNSLIPSDFFLFSNSNGFSNKTNQKWAICGQRYLTQRHSEFQEKGIYAMKSKQCHRKPLNNNMWCDWNEKPPHIFKICQTEYSMWMERRKMFAKKETKSRKYTWNKE